MQGRQAWDACGPMIWRTAALSGIDPGEKGMLLHFESAKCHLGGWIAHLYR